MYGFKKAVKKSKMETQCPECEKMAAVKDQSRIIGEFLEWLRSEKEWEICELTGQFDIDIIDDYLSPVGFSTEELLAKFFNIDLDKVEKEKRQMLDELRRKE